MLEVPIASQIAASTHVSRNGHYAAGDSELVMMIGQILAYDTQFKSV
jgi:hypothetical protein